MDDLQSDRCPALLGSHGFMDKVKQPVFLAKRSRSSLDPERPMSTAAAPVGVPSFSGQCIEGQEVTADRMLLEQSI